MIRAVKNKIKSFVSPKFIYLNKFKIERGDVVIDLGANVGEVCEYFLSKGAHLHAYEPNPYAYEILQKRIGANKNATLHQAAVSNFTGKSKLWLHEQHTKSEVAFSQAGSLQAEKANVSEDYIEVSVTDINDVLSDHSHIGLLKIDIEGGEYDIMDAVLENCSKIDHVLLETHEKKNKSFQEMNDILMNKIERSEFKDRIYLDWF